jgi:hypothetical protein
MQDADTGDPVADGRTAQRRKAGRQAPTDPLIFGLVVHMDWEFFFFFLKFFSFLFGFPPSKASLGWV